MNLQNFENHILSILQEKFPDFTIESFPSKFEEYTFTSPIGCILLKYNRTKFSKQETIWAVTQTAMVNFSVITGYRGLQNYNEVHPMQTLLRNTLKGFEYEGKKITLGSEEFLTEVNGDLYIGLEILIDLFETEDEKYDEILV